MERSSASALPKMLRTLLRRRTMMTTILSAGAPSSSSSSSAASLSTSAQQRVGFVGLGAMGWWLAKHINDMPTVHNCKVWNRTSSRAQAHASAFGTSAVSTLSELRDCDVIVSCVSTSADLQPLVESVVGSLDAHTTWVDCTSGDPTITKQLGALLLNHSGVEMVDAPVSGGPRGAEAKALAVIVGASDKAFAKVQTTLSSFASKVTHVGPLGAGHAIKSINNMLNVSQLVLASEGLAALTNMGVDPARALEAINASSGRSLMTQQRVPEEVLTRRFGYGFKLGLMRKDVEIAVSVLDAFFPKARLMRLSSEIVAEAEDAFSFNADYTAVTKLIEQKAETEITTEDALKHHKT